MDSALDSLMSASERDAVRAPIERAMTLPAQAYASAELFALEVERIFRRGWTALLFESALPASGDVRPVDLFGVPLVVVRGDDARLRVFHNICPYDGCLAVLEEARALSEITVLYHGWRYDLRGTLTGVPYWDGTPHGDVASLGTRDGNLIEVRSEVRLGVLFVNLDGGAPALRDWLAPFYRVVGSEFLLDEVVPAVDAQGRAIIETRTVGANWKTYLENAAINVLHESFTHALYRKSPEVPRVSNREPTFRVHLERPLIAFSYRRADTGSTYDAIPLPHAGVRREHPPETGYFATLYPNLVVPVLDAMVKVNICLPRAPDETFLQHLSFYHPDALARADFLDVEREVREMFHEVYREDQMAIEAVQRARGSPAWRQHFYAPFWDEQHHYLNQLVLADLEA